MGLHYENVELPSSPEDLDNRPEFVEALKEAKFWNRVPLMNAMAVTDLRNMQIVRFRGMLQDMAEPEIYATRYEVRDKTGITRLENGKYREYHGMHRGEHIVSSDRPELGMRRSFYVVTVPGLNTWAGASMDNEETSKATEAKRARLSDHQPDDAMEDENPLDDSEAMEADRTGPKYPGRGCMLVVYDDYDTFPLNCLVDVVGFVWLDESAGAQKDQQIPRLHAIQIRRLPCNNPLLAVGVTATPKMDQRGLQ